MYSLYEYNQAGHMKVIREESWEEGRKEGKEEGRKEGREQGIEEGVAIGENRLINIMLQKGKTPEEIAELCDYSVDDILKVKKK